MPRVVRPVFGTQKRKSKMQRRHQSRYGSRTSRQRSIPRVNNKRQKKDRLDDEVETFPSSIFAEEYPNFIQDVNHPQDACLNGNAAEGISESDGGGYCIQDHNITDCNHIDIRDSSKLELSPVQVYRCQQCGVTLSDMVNEKDLLELDRPLSSERQPDYDLQWYLSWICSATSVDLDYQHAPESTFGYPSEVSSPETILDCGLPTLLCSYCQNRSFLPYGNLGPTDYLSNFTPNLSPRPDSPFLQSQHTTKTTMDTDELISNTDIANKSQFFPLEAQPQAWLPKQNVQNLKNQFQLATPDDQSKAYDWAVNQNLDDILLSPQDLSNTSQAETQNFPPIRAPEEWKPEKNFEGENKQVATSIQPNGDQATSSKKWWACPWYKKDSLKYQECSKYKLQRIKDVKQHTSRKHMKPDIYCPVCFELFTAAGDRDEHIQKKGCESRARPEFDGISEEQRKELNQIANRGKSDVDQWYYMWDTIFPGTCRPQSPYLGNGWEKLLPLLRNFWNQKQPEIISKALQISLPKCEPQAIQCVVDNIFDLFEAESCWGAGSDVSLENAPPKIKQEEQTKPGIYQDITSNELSQQKWDLSP